jgi:hypothetical protein
MILCRTAAYWLLRAAFRLRCWLDADLQSSTLYR